MGHSINGRNLCGLIAGYMVIKSILNLILDFGFGNIIMLAVAVGLGFSLIISFKYMNFLTAAFLVAMVVINIKGNISGIGLNKNLIYIVESVIDLVCAYKLVFDKDIREHFNHS